MKLSEATNILKHLYESEDRISYKRIKGTKFKATPYNSDADNPIIDSFLSDEETTDNQRNVTTLAQENIKAAAAVLRGLENDKFLNELEKCCSSEDKLNKTLSVLILYNAIIKEMGDNYFDKLNNASGFSSAINLAKSELNKSLGLFNKFVEENKPVKKEKENDQEEDSEKDKKQELDNDDKKDKEQDQDNKEKKGDSAETDYTIEQLLKFENFLPKNDEIDEEDDEVRKIRKAEIDISAKKINLKGLVDAAAEYEDGSKEKKEVEKEIEKEVDSLKKIIIKYKLSCKNYKKSLEKE